MFTWRLRFKTKVSVYIDIIYPFIKFLFLYFRFSDAYSCASDVYAFGITLNEVLAGRQPTILLRGGLRMFTSMDDKNHLHQSLLAMVDACLAEEAACRKTMAELVTELSLAYDRALEMQEESQEGKGLGSDNHLLPIDALSSSNSNSSLQTQVAAFRFKFSELTSNQVCAFLEYAECAPQLVFFVEQTKLSGTVLLYVL